MFAAVDLGSNSFRLHIGRYDGDTIRIIKSERDPIRLGAGLDRQGLLTDAAMQTAVASLTRLRSVLAAYPLDAVRVVATNTLRIAKNAAAFLPAAEQAIGYPIEIISGEEEGRLIYLGVASAAGRADERRLVIDIGGGSTEVILGQGQDIHQVESFTIGTVGHSQAFFAGGSITRAAFEQAILSARSHFEEGGEQFLAGGWREVYGSSGTIRAIAEAIVKNSLGDGTLSLKSLHALQLRLIESGHASRIDLLGLKPDRAAIIPGGLAILIGLMQELRIKSIAPVETGLRMGVLWDLQLRATKRDRRELSVQEFARRFHVDIVRAGRVAGLSGELYAQLKPGAAGHAGHLHWSAMLHEIGMAVSHSGYHKHGAYLIEHADLAGFTTAEQRLMSKLVLGQKGNLRKLNGMLGDVEFAKAVLALRLAVMLMHARIDDVAGAVRIKMKSRIELEIRRDWLAQHPTLSYWLGKEQEWWAEAGMEFLVKHNYLPA